MKKDPDILSPEHSPQYKGDGVKRANNRPLYIIAGILCLFLMVIGLVASKRASRSEDKEPSTLSMGQTKQLNADAVLAGEKLAHLNAPSITTEIPKIQMALPVAVIDDPNALPIPPRLTEEVGLSDEMKQVKQEKLQAFVQAIKAKINKEVPETYKKKLTTTHDDSTRTPENLSTQFKVRLAQLQSSATPQNTSKGFFLLNQEAQGQQKNRWDMPHNMETPQTRFELLAGGIIPGAMISGVNPEIPGQVVAQVNQNVYDTATGKYLLIPMGTKIVGVFSTDVMYGQSAVLIAWQLLEFPDGKRLDIGSMPGADSQGYSGFRDKVDNHYGRIFGSAILMSGITAGVTYSQNQNQVPLGQPTAQSTLSEALGQQLGQVSTQLISKNLDIAPSLTIRPGYEFHIQVTKNLVFNKHYQAFDY